MNLSVIAEKRPGHVIPEAMIEHLNKLRGSVSGFAIRHSDEGKPVIEFEFGEVAQPTAAFMKIQDAGKDNSVLFFFSNKAGKFDTKKDIQPFALMNGDECMLAVFVEGDFSKYAEPDGTRSEEGLFWTNYLEPLLIETAADCSSIDKFYEKLRRKTFQDTLENASSHRCAFAFLPLHGEPILFGKNDLGSTYDWGSVSQHLDFGVEEKKHIVAQAADAVAGAVGKAKRTFFSSSPSPAAPVSPPAAPTAPDVKHAAPAAPTPPVEPPKTDTAIDAGSVWLAPPEGCEKGVRNAWYRAFNKNQLPKDHERRPKVAVPPHMVPFAQKKVQTAGELKNLLAEMKTGQKIIEPPKDMRQPETKEVSKVGNTTIKEVVNNDKPQNVADYIPAMNPTELTKMTGLALSFMPKDILKRPTLLDLQKVEEGWPKFSAATGVPIGDTMYWTPDQLMQMDKKALVQLLNEYKITFRSTDAFKLLCSKELVDRAAAEKATHVQAKEQLAPEPEKIAAAGGSKRRFFN